MFFSVEKIYIREIILGLKGRNNTIWKLYMGSDSVFFSGLRWIAVHQARLTLNRLNQRMRTPEKDFIATLESSDEGNGYDLFESSDDDSVLIE
ncbi:hypothetical protein JTB14_030287 [Gonioctena quinquepunctata]|nr:hypothetical protein JTB14_030287 [Gonioctena quinquepunctata]